MYVGWYAIRERNNGPIPVGRSFSKVSTLSTVCVRVASLSTRHTDSARFMGPSWGPSGADSTQMGPTPQMGPINLAIRVKYWLRFSGQSVNHLHLPDGMWQLCVILVSCSSVKGISHIAVNFCYNFSEMTRTYLAIIGSYRNPIRAAFFVRTTGPFRNDLVWFNVFVWKKSTRMRSMSRHFANAPEGFKSLLFDYSYTL